VTAHGELKIAMTHASRWFRLVAPLFLCGWVVLSPATSRAMAEDPEAIAKITKLNKKAIEEYENLNFEEARKILKEALDLCTASGLDRHPIKARTHVHLGIVILSGFKQREVAIKQFRRALDIQPDIKPTKILANPEVQEAFDEAAAGGGTDKAEASTSPDKGGGAAGITHQPVLQASQGGAVPIKATVDPSVGAAKVMLFYRSGGAGDYMSVEMSGSGAEYTASIPASATSGNLVNYYIEAQAADGSSKATKGVASDPIAISLKGAGAGGDEEVTKEEEEEEGQGMGGKLYFALMAGSGVGWTTGAGEVNVEHQISPAGFAPAQIGHLAPEIGYFVKPGLMLSLQGRFQLVTGATAEHISDTTQCGGDKLCSAAGGAIAMFARATWLFGTDKLHPFVSVALGGGYIRHVAEFKTAPPNCGPNAGSPGTCIDTVPAGPILVGPGGGLIYNLSPNFGLVVGVNAPLGFPKFTFHIDLNAGVALRL
jgi:hypothetical protein